MATDSDYKEKIKDYTWTDLLELWQEIEKQTTPEWEAGKALEYLILKAFQLDGASIKWPYSVSMPNSGETMEQIDGIVYFDNFSLMIECKDHNINNRKKSINIEPIAKLRNQLMRRPTSTIGCIFSTGGFTQPAKTLVNFISNQTILLWEGEEIEYCIKNKTICKQIVEKYRFCVEHGLNDYNIIPYE